MIIELYRLIVIINVFRSYISKIFIVYYTYNFICFIVLCVGRIRFDFVFYIYCIFEIELLNE